MRLLAFLTCSALALGGCAGTSPVVAPEMPWSYATLNSRSPNRDLKAALDRLLPDSLFEAADAAVLVVSLDRNETLYAFNPRRLFHPASNEKLFTAAAALRVLGPSYELATVFTLDSASGTIGVQGRGDPLITTADVDSMAAALAPLIPPRESWRLQSDGSYFDDLYLGEGWTWDAEPAAYAAPVTPLMLNGNTITVTVEPAPNPGELSMVTTDPVTAYVDIENTAVTVADSVPPPASLEISRKWRERSNTITVNGTIESGRQPREATMSLWQPDRYAAMVLAERLTLHGVPVGEIVMDTLALPGEEVYRFTHRVDSALTYMLKVSDNLSAEALLKVVGAEREGTPGTTAAGRRYLNQYLDSLGVDTLAISIGDGSGVSRYNLTCAEVIVTLLEAMHADTALYGPLYHGLPIAGVDGTLERRMQGTAAEGNLRAKTGTLSGVSALSGYVRTRDGELLAFSMLMQHYATRASRYRAVQDRIGQFLAEFTRRYY
jgi:D-alanyl-D-alanine carboxypeptidase/D-alanyl-D-alanine-endopeptidase (penicillin-binding protein 4)